MLSLTFIVFSVLIW